MSEASNPDRVSRQLILVGQRPITPVDEKYFVDALRRCSPSTRQAAREFRLTGDLERLPEIIDGLIEHFVENGARAKLASGDDSLRLVEDLGIDSLTMLEIVSLAEDVLQVSIDNGQIRPFRTVGDVKRFVASRLEQAVPEGR
jgi:3-hydroxyacyl-[acyl-carrier-protein] dehydratase